MTGEAGLSHPRTSIGEMNYKRVRLYIKLPCLDYPSSLLSPTPINSSASRMALVRPEDVRNDLRPLTHAIPPELLAKIFTYCTDSDTLDLRHHKGSFLPWVLGHVCTRWRHIVLAEPLLWKHIDARGYAPVSPSTLNLIHEVLAHRGGRSDIELSIAPGCDTDWIALFNLCTTHPTRLRHLRLPVDAWYSPVHLRHPVSAFDNIQSLTLTFCRPLHAGAASDMDGTTVITAFAAARSLKKVEICHEGSYNPGLVDITSFPWAQLTSLTITCISTSAISRILCECDELTDLDVGLQVDGSAPHQVIPPIIKLSHLGSLSVRFGMNCDALLDRLVVPVLKNLWFGRWALASQACVFNLIQRSECDLEALRCPVEETDIIPLLRTVPSLRKFDISSTEPISKESLDAMQALHLTPHLRALTVPVRSMRDIVTFLRKEHIESTWAGYGRVCDVHVAITKENFLRDQEWFEGIRSELMKGGCLIEVTLI